jgi:hypothetical protein
MSLAGANRPKGDITTLLDLTDRDAEENALFPLNTEITWFTRDSKRRTLPSTPHFQEIPFRGPASFGQRFTFDVGSLQAGDLVHGMAIQIRLTHWLDPTSAAALAGDLVTHAEDQGLWWQFINNLGANILASAELEVDGVSIETLDGDFIHIHNSLFPDVNAQFGMATDQVGYRPIKSLVGKQNSYPYPTEDGIVTVLLPFFFMRVRFNECLPLTAIKEGNVRVNVTLRPFNEVVRQVRGYRADNCSTPLSQKFDLIEPHLSFLQIAPGYPSVTLTSPNSAVSIMNNLNQVYAGRFQTSYSVTGSCRADFTADYTNFVIGLSPNPSGSNPTNFPTTAPYYDIYIRFSISGTLIIWNLYNGQGQSYGSGTVSKGDFFSLIYNATGEFIALQNQTVIGNFTATASGPLFLVASFNSYAAYPPCNLRNISFTAVADAQISYPNTKSVISSITTPDLAHVCLLVFSSLVSGTFREKIMREPYEFLYRELQSFLFDEPLTYQVAKSANTDVVSVQLPIEANHPLEEIIWVVRRRAVRENNEWYNFGSFLERDFAYAPALEQTPLMMAAKIQANGQTLVEGDERYFRRQIGRHHNGGVVAYTQYIYGYSFAKSPGTHQPSGTANASRLNSLRLAIDVQVPSVFQNPAAHASKDITWEVRVYVLALNWMRVQNGLVNRVYQD